MTPTHCTGHEPFSTELTFGYPLELGGMLNPIKAYICKKCGVAYVSPDRMQELRVAHATAVEAMPETERERRRLAFAVRFNVPDATPSTAAGEESTEP